MPPLNENGQSKLTVLIAPDSFVSDSEGFALVNLRHPKTNEAALFGFKNGAESHDVREIITFNQEFGAFFIDDVIESDGRLHLATPIDPLLLVLPYLKSAKRHIPLDHLLEEDQDFPEAANRLAPVLIGKGLSSIANPKGSADLNVWQYDEKKTLAYLGKRVDRVSKELARQGSENSSTSDDDKRCAWQIVSDYLDAETSQLLGKHLDIKEPVKKQEINQKPATVTGSVQLPSGPKENARPLEDYSEDLEPKAKMQKLSTPNSAKQKALAKSAAGSKSIMSFFTKK